MPDRPETACLVVADISGYTSYLAGVELDHAQDILADLIDSVVLPTMADKLRRHVVLHDGHVQWTSVLVFFRKR